jgi:hypothetical protein
MKFTEHILLAALLVPTAAIAVAAAISVATPISTVPVETGIPPTALAVYYADLERQP